jgi:hypothetical protein
VRVPQPNAHIYRNSRGRPRQSAVLAEHTRQRVAVVLLGGVWQLFRDKRRAGQSRVLDRPADDVFGVERSGTRVPAVALGDADRDGE